MNNKICVIFTGGTIGSAEADGKISLSGGAKKQLLETYERREGKRAEFTAVEAVNMLSENVQKNDLDAIYSAVKDALNKDYDGIIITHGTDTLCFTANYFSQLLCDAKKPIVLVSALFPLSDKRSNGTDNFDGAVKFILKERLPGVYVSFKNDGEPIKIHLASRLIFSDQLTGFYHSVLGEHLAEIEGENVTIVQSPHNPTREQIRLNAQVAAPVDNELCDDIMFVTARSLLYFAMYDFEKVKPKAIILELYHSGTVCMSGGAHNFVHFAEYCRRFGVPIVIAPMSSEANVYESMATLPEGVIPCYDMSLEMCIVKVMCALAKGLPPQSYFADNLFFEKLR